MRLTMISFIVGILMWVLAPPSPATGEQVSFYVCPRLSAPPVLDGKLDDACWEKVEPITTLYAFRTTAPFVVPSEIKTTVKAGYDEQAIYFAVFCQEEHMERIRAQATKRDDQNLWKDDCVEIYLSADHSMQECRKFTANSIGTQNDFLGAFNLEWSGLHWTVAAQKAPQGWGIEFRIPWEDLGKKAAEGAIWSFGLIHLSWAHAADGSYRGVVSAPGLVHGHHDKTMGYMLFGDSFLKTLNELVSAASQRKGAAWQFNTRTGFFGYHDYTDDTAKRLADLDYARQGLWKSPDSAYASDLTAVEKEVEALLNQKKPEDKISAEEWIAFDNKIKDLRTRIENLKSQLALERLLKSDF